MTDGPPEGKMQVEARDMVWKPWRLREAMNIGYGGY